MALSNFELNKVIEELQILKGAHLNNFQHICANKYKISLGKYSLLVAPPDTMHLTEYSLPAKAPSSLVMHVRKQLKNSRVEAIEQRGYDRVATLHFSNGFRLVAELFGKGNLVLVNPDGNTQWAMRYESWKDREIKPKKPYSYPASQGLNPLEMSFSEFEKIFTQKDVIRSLVKGINMSPFYLEEACFRAKIDKNASSCDKKTIFREIKGLVNSEIQSGIQGRPVPVVLALSTEKFAPTNSFNAALDTENQAVETPEKTGRVASIEHRLNEQKKAIEMLEKKSVEAKDKGDRIYLHMHSINKRIERAREMLKKKKSWKDIEQEIGCRAEPKSKTIEIELD